MIILDNIHSLTDFKRNTSAYVEKMKDTKAPLVLTVNGEAELVVQSAKAYQELLDRIRQIEEELKRAKQEALQSAITIGVKQIESGEYVEYNEESLATLSEDIKARGRKRKQAQDGDA
ncbi:MAG TPA: type II toxin-antitoxin system Phd/YefM family antitoxin [Coleofasciculaceae cyanobacterium]|jgi:prevent-host-death family protein